MNLRVTCEQKEQGTPQTWGMIEEGSKKLTSFLHFPHTHMTFEVYADR